jgi:hypothetical protein
MTPTGPEATMRPWKARPGEHARARAFGRRVAAGIIALLLATPLACGDAARPSAPREPALDVTLVLPSAGPIGGGTHLTVMGVGFRAGATVTVGGVPATGVRVVSRISITAVAPAGREPGPVTVTVTNPDGRSVELPARYEYVSDDRVVPAPSPWDY